MQPTNDEREALKECTVLLDKMLKMVAFTKHMPIDVQRKTAKEFFRNCPSWFTYAWSRAAGSIDGGIDENSTAKERHDFVDSFERWTVFAYKKFKADTQEPHT